MGDARTPAMWRVVTVVAVAFAVVLITVAGAGPVTSAPEGNGRSEQPATSATPRGRTTSATGDGDGASSPDLAAVPSTLLAPVERQVTSAPPTADAEASPAASSVEKVTTTEDKVRRVVLGLIAVGVVSAGLTIAFARHTSPRRRAAVASRDAARARRLAAATSIAQLGLDVRDAREAGRDAATAPLPPRAARTRRVAPPEEPAGAEPRRVPPPEPPAADAAEARPNPRPQPRRRDPDAASG